jgi:hypothetical protein
MLNILYESDIVSMGYHPDDKLIEMVWKKNSNSEEYRRMFGVMIKFSEKNKIRFFLSDMRQEGLVKLDDVRWLSKEVLKRAIEHKVERIALVVEDTIFSSVYTDVLKKKLEKSPIKIRVFNDINNAKAWLLS